MVHPVVMFLLVIGALAWLFVSLFVGGVPILLRALYLAVGIAGIYVMFRRDFYLPFLGETAMPCTGLLDRAPPGATREVTVVVPPNARVLYWAAEPEMEGLKGIKDWKAAYAQFENVGVTTAGGDGVAHLIVRVPQAYTVPALGGLWNKKISPHVHYRVCGKNGMLHRVETVPIEVQGVEGFEDVASAAAISAPAPPTAPKKDVARRSEGMVPAVDPIPTMTAATASAIDMDAIGAPQIMEVLKVLQMQSVLSPEGK